MPRGGHMRNKVGGTSRKTRRQWSMLSPTTLAENQSGSGAPHCAVANEGSRGVRRNIGVSDLIK